MRSPPTRQSVIAPISAHLKLGASVVVDVAADGPATAVEAQSFALLLVAKLDATRRFSTVKLKGGAADAADLLLKCQVADIKRVTETDRMLVGALAGRARMDVHVLLIEVASEKTVGEATVSGVSSAGSVFAGTTEQAIQRAAQAAAEFVLSGKP